jgi:putative transposase
VWVPHDTRDTVVDFVNRWSELTEIAVVSFIFWIGISKSKFYDWRARYGMANEHNGRIPRDFWLEEWEKKAIIRYYHEHSDEGYRRLTFMMLDQDVVAASPATIWRVLNKEGLLRRWKSTPTKKGTGFQQPLRPHQHWLLTFHISTSPARSIICAAFWTDAADISCTGTFESQ